MAKFHSFLWLICYTHIPTPHFLIHSTIVGPLDCVHILATVTEMKNELRGVYIYLSQLVFLFASDKYPKVELLDCMVVFILNIFKNFPTVSIIAVSI